MNSVFDGIRKDACELISKAEDFTDLKKRLKLVLEDWDLSEENQYYG